MSPSRNRSIRYDFRRVLAPVRDRTLDLTELMNHDDETRPHSSPPWLTSEDHKFIATRYELLRDVAHGGMGVVYHAIQLSFEREVAIKIVRHGQSTDRFRREGKLLAKLHSPYVVTVHELETLPSGLAMLVMEWVEGRDLAQEMSLQGGRVVEETSVSWMRDTCKGMIAAEDKRIVHRDLKPSNILLDRLNQARVSDFGLARSPTEWYGTPLTSAGTVMGTPLYMAPEQAERPRSVDTRSDIYSFGATYYHALTGVPPFLGDSDFAILFKHKTEPLISPRDRCEDVSENIAELLERCLAKSPDERFQSFRDVLAELDENNETSPWLHVDDPALSLYLERLRSHRRTYFSDELQANRTTYFEDWFPVGDVDVFRFPNGRVLRVVAGDITTQPVDAIVSSDDSNLSMSGGVSLAILKAAGERLRDEALIYAPVRPGRAIVTSAGNLGARFVFHSVTMGLRDLNYAEPSKDLIFEILRSCFYHAETLNVKSIAFPLLATGSGGFSKDICLEIMFAYLARVLLRSITPVNEVRIVLYTPGNNVR